MGWVLGFGGQVQARVQFLGFRPASQQQKHQKPEEVVARLSGPGLVWVEGLGFRVYYRGLGLGFRE